MKRTTLGTVLCIAPALPGASRWLLAAPLAVLLVACAPWRQPAVPQPAKSAAALPAAAVPSTAATAPPAAAPRPSSPAAAATASPVLSSATPPAATAAPAPSTAAAPTAATPMPAAPSAPPAPPPVLPYNDAVLAAANALFSNAQLPPDAAPRLPLVIDPLIDGQTGVQSVATRALGQRVSDLVRAKYPRYELQPFNTTSLARGPMLFIGTFTPVDKERKTAGAREQYRICLALVDLRSGKIVSKGLAFSSTENVDITPLPFFQDAPAWAPDAATDSYVRTCQGTRSGDPINPQYWDRIVAAALINDAINAYHDGRYEEAFDLYRGIARTPSGDQLRVYNGMYLAAWKLGRKDEATTAFAWVVDYGLAAKRLGMKFLFRPGSTLFTSDPWLSAPYPLWLKQIATRTGSGSACIEVSGHTSRTGTEPINDRLSMLRAQYVQQRLLADAPVLSRRTTAVGKGWRENIIGLGTDDVRDALDRRVEFKVIDCPV